jgi:HD-like signal output (HDOD) protein
MAPMNSALLLEEYEGRLAKGVNREELIACAEKIPPLPHAVLKVLKLLDDPDSDAGQLADAVSSDAGLASALLKLANSAAFAQAGRVVSVEQAVTLVGFAKLRSLVLATTLRGMAKCELADQLVWENALATAMIGRRLAETVGRQWADEVFLMGLLHGLGQFVLLANEQTRAAYSSVLRRIRETGVDYVTAELEEIGFSHPLIGALVASRWNFPPEVCEAILHYHDPLEGIDTPTDRKLALVKLADLLAHAAGLGHPEGFPTDRETMQQLVRWLGLNRPDDEVMPALISEAQEQFKAEAQMWSP